jgi:hypothetical protein
MAEINQQKLIVSLIRDNLINTKLLNGLDALGLNADNYSLRLGDTIFELMGFDDSKDSDKVFEYYIGELKKANRINIASHPERLDSLADNIYFNLVIKKLKEKPVKQKKGCPFLSSLLISQRSPPQSLNKPFEREGYAKTHHSTNRG